MSDKKDKIIKDTVLITTTLTGIIGAMTGIPIVQAIAYLPAILERGIIEKAGKSQGIEEKLHKQLKEAIQKTCDQMQVKLELKNKSLADFFRTVSMRMQTETCMMFSKKELDDWMKHSIHKEQKWECPDITEKDKTILIEEFVNEFIKQVTQYQELGIFLAMTMGFNNGVNVVEVQNSTVALNEIEGDVEDYAEKFEEPLFLHKNEDKENQICLKDVFVIPAAETHGHWNEKIHYADCDDIFKAIRDFTSYTPTTKRESKPNILFIEGQAASGKSSLVSWLSWQYHNRTQEAQEILGDRRLIVVRLRDLIQQQKVLDIEDPFYDIYTYLVQKEDDYRSRVQNEREVFDNTALVLDGFDELCMVEGFWGSEKEQYFYHMYRRVERFEGGCKVIVTTRPSYLECKKLDFFHAHLRIKAFTKEKRKQFIGKYEKKEMLSSDVKQNLFKEYKNEFECLVESPLLIYMVAAKGVVLGDAINIWYLYNQIFAIEVYVRNYDGEGAHIIKKYREYLYALTTEIANAVYTEKQYFINIEKLLERNKVQQLVQKLEGLKEDKTIDYQKMENILSDCFGVASYFKVGDKLDKDGIRKNAVEFYHNNIRDYFMCEYIWRNMERIYSKIPEQNEQRQKYFISEFQKIFQYLSEAPVAIQFFKNKVIHMKETGVLVDFIERELRERYFKEFFGKMLETGFLLRYEYDGKSNILSMMLNVYSSVFQIYHAIYLAHLKQGERIDISNKGNYEVINKSNIWNILFFSTDISNQSMLNFDKMSLRNIELTNYNFQGCSFCNAWLDCVQFRTCDLSNTTCIEASLRLADLVDSSLYKINLEHAKLTSSDLRNTNMKHANLRHADLRDVDLRYTDLDYADLTDADLRDAKMNAETSFKNAIFKNTLVSKKHVSYLNAHKIEGFIVK